VVDLSGVTPPIYLPPGSLVQVSATCVARLFRLVPTDEVVEICEACIRAAATYYEGKILLHEYEFMSNHLHLLATDLGDNGRGVLPDFMRYLDGMLTKNLNKHRGISGSNFEGYTVQIIDRDDTKRILEAVLYIQNQAVAAGLTRTNAEWKHCSSRNLAYGEKSTVVKPELGIWANRMRKINAAAADRSGRSKYVGHSRTPDQFSLTLHKLPGFGHMQPDELRTMIARKLVRLELEAMVRRAITGGQVLGWEKARSIDHNHIPTSPRQLFDRRPTHAASTPERREAARVREETFRREYAIALEAFLDGDHTVEFPHGTYLMARRFRARVARGPG